MQEFLTQEEVIELTGRKRIGAQLDWLTKIGWIFQTNAAGRPIISREYARAKLGGNKPEPVVKAGPNFAALMEDSPSKAKR